ncbi:MAG: enoyl-CoA hydratase/isomerase family protein [Gammaproteobacteria bacterium]|nr:enoyl-CoA hydratase/isomerase family protein [Gammaproteobacteria bacterium]
MSHELDLHHWHLKIDAESIAWLQLDCADMPNNVLSSGVLSELAEIVDLLENWIESNLIVAIACTSAKTTGFAYGADVAEFAQFESATDVRKAMAEVHELFDRIEKLSVPTAVGIDGLCLGGGLELALAFGYRIAVRDRTKLGFPEVRLGLFPGFAGTARSIRAMGGLNAMQLMLGGGMISAAKAKSQNLLQRLVDDPGQLRWSLRKALLSGAKARGPRPLAEATSLPGIRHLLARTMRQKVSAKANPAHYPAPYQLIDNWTTAGADAEQLKVLEQEHFPILMVGDTSKNLQRVFFLSEAMKRLAKGAKPVKRVHVIGAGVMGGDIAAWCVASGLSVTLQDLDPEQIEKARERAQKILKRKLKSATLARNALQGLVADVQGKGVARADVIIEAAVERLDVKQNIFSSLEANAKPDAILATNTSALPLEEIAAQMTQPERLVGIHFFNPVASMPLVEVVKSVHTADEVLLGALGVVKQLGKYPVVVKSSPGFLVNRCLTAYMFKALELGQSGQAMTEIDHAALSFGMPMGPFELMDQVGLDIAASVGQNLGYEDGAVADLLRHKIESGKLGKKSGEGFYQWINGKVQRQPCNCPEAKLDELAQKLLQPLIDEARACVAEGVVESEDFADAGLIFGTGFAPFRGGPLHYAKQQEGAA